MVLPLIFQVDELHTSHPLHSHTHPPHPPHTDTLPHREINPDVDIEVHNYNITTVDNFQHFMERIR